MHPNQQIVEKDLFKSYKQINNAGFGEIETYFMKLLVEVGIPIKLLFKVYKLIEKE